MPLRKLLFQSENNVNYNADTIMSTSSSSIGKFQYLLASIIIFVSCIIVEGSTFSSMSKVVPLKKKFSVISCGLLVTILSSIGRHMADYCVSFAVVFNIRVIEIDIVNLLFVPLTLISAIFYVVVKRNYFFLN